MNALDTISLIAGLVVGILVTQWVITRRKAKKASAETRALWPQKRQRFERPSAEEIQARRRAYWKEHFIEHPHSWVTSAGNCVAVLLDTTTGRIKGKVTKREIDGSAFYLATFFKSTPLKEESDEYKTLSAEYLDWDKAMLAVERCYFGVTMAEIAAYQPEEVTP